MTDQMMTPEQALEIKALRAEAVKLRNIRADTVHAAALANIRAEQLAGALLASRPHPHPQRRMLVRAYACPTRPRPGGPQ